MAASRSIVALHNASRLSPRGKFLHCSYANISKRWGVFSGCEAGRVRRFSSDRARPVSVIVHGGAWTIPDELVARNLHACETAAAAAYKLLSGGGDAVDAVEVAVRSLEDDTSLNAGRGSSLNELGQPECDAMIMDGSLHCGAVAGVQVLHPISLARHVMDHTEHIMMIGDGAMELAAGLETDEERAALVTEAAKEEWRTWREYKSNVSALFGKGHDTVGCVAFDSTGRLACGTSTGGVVGKRRGRVGDSPLVGSGGYADNSVGAVSATGHGEAIARVTLSRLALWLVEIGRSPAKALEEALEIMHVRCGSGGGGHGGLIFIGRSGEISKSFTTQRMAWASVEGSKGLTGGECKSGIERSSLAS